MLFRSHSRLGQLRVISCFSLPSKPVVAIAVLSVHYPTYLVFTPRDSSRSMVIRRALLRQGWHLNVGAKWPTTSLNPPEPPVFGAVAARHCCNPATPTQEALLEMSYIHSKDPSFISARPLAVYGACLACSLVYSVQS